MKGPFYDYLYYWVLFLNPLFFASAWADSRYFSLDWNDRCLGRWCELEEPRFYDGRVASAAGERQ